MTATATKPRFDNYFTVGQAAKFLGVSPATLRNWDRSGKLRPQRHPQNGYRIYLHSDLQALLDSVGLITTANSNPAEIDDAQRPTSPPFSWGEIGDCEHFVQFYEEDAYLIGSVADYAALALENQQASIIIATQAHCAAIKSRLASSGIDVTQAIASERLIVLDAAQTLSQFVVDGAPDADRFQETVGAQIARLSQRFDRIHAFGEMVALLWAEGNRPAAIELERLWNELATQHRFTLYCAYPMTGFNQADAAGFDGVCTCHTRVMPAESYSLLAEPRERSQAVAILQQRAQSLAAEIEHRRAVEQALGSRERELADFFENATEGIHKVGPDGTILWANRAEYGLLGYTADEYIGHPITQFHADADVIDEMLARLRRNETLHNFPARLRCKDGTFKHVLINSSACFENGQFAYTRCFTRDVTDLWHAEQALRDAARRKDEFLATLAHELRNPLAPIGNALQELTLSGVDAESLGVMQRQHAQLTRLVDDLLDVSRITCNKIELRLQTVELSSVIRSAVETSRPLIDAARHQLTVALPAEVIYLQADATRLAQVFSNLLNNSAKYTPPGGKIQLQAQVVGRDVLVRVRDNGLGISPASLPHVFDMFRQFDGAQRAPGGLGIGLSLVRRLVEMHGGTVRAQSDGPGRGAEFTVQLPMTLPLPKNHLPQKTPSTSSRPDANTPRRRILIADDNRDSASTLSRLLKLKGHEVCTANDGLQAVEAASAFLPDVILMDVGMPQLDGYEATRRIRQTPEGRNATIVALTGWGQAEDIQQSQAAGCSAHLVKPVDFAALDRILAGAL